MDEEDTEPRLKDDGQTKGKIELHSEKNPLLIKASFVLKHCAKIINHDLFKLF